MTPMISIAVLLSIFSGTVGGTQPPSIPPLTESLSDSVVAYDLDGTVTELTEQEQSGDETTLTVGSDILFDFASAELTADAAAALTAQIDDIPQGAEVSVVGHTDAIGSTAANQKLSVNRAKAVASALEQARPDLRTTATGKGESEPVASNDDAQDRALNRRVVLSWQS